MNHAKKREDLKLKLSQAKPGSPEWWDLTVAIARENLYQCKRIRQPHLFRVR